jgi:branched-chain amino acid transport system permease protein
MAQRVSEVLPPLPQEPAGTAWYWVNSLLPILIGLAFAYGLYMLQVQNPRSFYLKITSDVGIAIILAVSLNIVNGFTGQLHLGHAAFMSIGGYTSGFVTYYGSMWLFESTVKIPVFFGKGELLFLGGVILGGLVAAFFGWLLGLPSLRLRGDYLAIVTLGFAEIVRVIFQNTNQVIRTREAFQEASTLEVVGSLGGALGFLGTPKYTNLFYVYVFVTLVLVVAHRLKFSSTGRAFFSIREDEIAAEAMGINTAKYKVRAFVISAFFAGIAGGLFAHMLGNSLTAQSLAFNKSVEVVIMVVLGGMGSISGSVLAAILLTILPEFLRDFAQYRMIIYAILLIVMMLVRPQGLFGLSEIGDVFRWIRQRFVGDHKSHKGEQA